MKSFWALLAFEARSTVVLFLYPFMFGFQSWNSVFHTGPANILNGDIGLFLVIVMSHGMLFQGGLFGTRSSGAAWQRTLEFPFTRAISRRTLYGAKMALMGILVSLALFIGALVGILFGFLFRFASASSGGVPDLGKVLILYMASLVLMLAYSALLLGTRRLRWCQRLLPIAFMIVPFVMMFWTLHQMVQQAGHGRVKPSPSVLWTVLPWATAHPALFFLAAALALVALFQFGCRRFIAQEVE